MTTNEDMLSELLLTKTVQSLSDSLNVCIGTIRRWQLLKHVPPQYRFDLMKLLSVTIDYTLYTSSDKDQFFTPSHIAEYCWEKFQSIVDVYDDYTFIEPSAGDGSFVKILPSGTIAMDIEPRMSDILKQDFLSWKPPIGKYIVFGNPPFGLRGHIALQFINHSFEFADYVCFILPQLFESDGKGSPRKRVHGYNLIHSEKLSTKFYTPENTNVDVNVVFQIWSKHDTNIAYAISQPNTDKMTIYSLSDGGTIATTRNKSMLKACDVYLPSTCFGKDAMKVYKSFNDLPNMKGYGIVFHKDKLQMIEKAKNTDWSNVCFLSTNSACNLRTSIIASQFD